MAVSKDWLDRTGTKICVEDIYQMQLMYEDPDSSHGPLVGTRSLYLSEKGSLYQCVEYYDADKTNERYPAGVEIALNADDMERLRSGDRKVENYKTCLSGLQKTTIWKYLSDPKQFKTVHEETNKVSDYSEITIKFGKGCMKEFEKARENGEPEKFEGTSTLEEIYVELNGNQAFDYRGHSLSVSDVLVIRTGQEDKAYFVDSIGFKEISGFLDQRNEIRDPLKDVYSNKELNKTIVIRNLIRDSCTFLAEDKYIDIDAIDDSRGIECYYAVYDQNLELIEQGEFLADNYTGISDEFEK